MELAYNWCVSAFTAVLLSFVVAKLLSIAVSGGDLSGGNVLCAGVDNGDKQKGRTGGVEDGKLEKRAKVGGSKSKRRRSKKNSSNAIFDSDFKGKSQLSEPVKISGGFSKADDFVDDCEKSFSGEKVTEIQEGGVEFSGIQKRDDYFGLDDPMKNEISSHEGVLVNPIEGLNQVEQPRVLVRVQNEDNVMSDEEEWEGIERNELEKDFVRAMNYVKEAPMNKLGSDVLMQFYDLQGAAMNGPCKISNRAKWNSWQKSGSMNPEEAMEKYITLLSDKVPGWIDDHPYDEE